jgi:single-strand DNA-binding protein
MNGVNKAIILGRVGQDPEIRETNGMCMAQMSVATTERGYITKSGKEIPEKTEWHKVVFFGSLAKVVEKYIHKGSVIYVEGKIRYRSYEDKSGNRKYATEINADSIQMLDKHDTAQQRPSGGEFATALNNYLSEKENSSQRPSTESENTPEEGDLPF